MLKRGHFKNFSKIVLSDFKGWNLSNIGFGLDGLLDFIRFDGK